MGSPHGHGFGEPIGGSNEKTVGKTPTRGLLADATPPEAAKTTLWHRIVTDPVDGGFTVNVLAGIFVHILLFIATLLGTCLCYGRARKRERIARYLENQTLYGQALALSKLLESQFAGSQCFPGTPPVLKVGNSTAQSSSAAAPPPVPENPAQTTEPTPAGSLPGSPPQATSSTSATPSTESTPADPKPGSPTSPTTGIPTEPKKAVQTTERQCGQLRRRNGYTSRSKSMGHAPSTSSESPPVATSRTDVAAQDHHVIDIPFSCRFPSLTDTTKNGDKFKETVKEELGVVFEHDVCSSRMMQARVPATEENLGTLRKVAIEGMKLNKGFTLQIGASFMYCCTGNPEKPVLLSLRDVEVPTIFKAEYSAGLLILRGRYLEGAEIRAATAEGYMIFASVKRDPVDDEVHIQEESMTSSKLANGIGKKTNTNLKTSIKKMALAEERIGTWRCTDLLPPVKLDQIQIFASKRVHIEGQRVTVRSELCSIQDTTLRTVIYKWVPTIIIMNILASQLWTMWLLFTNLVTNPLHPWFSYPTLAFTMYIIQLLIPSLEENVNYFIERLKLAISSFHVFPKPLASPTFFIRNGFCFQRGAMYLIYPPPPLAPPLPTKLEGHGKTIEEKKSHKKEGYLVAQRDWKWPSWRLSKKTDKYEKFDPDSNDHETNFDSNPPFKVLYGRGYFAGGGMNVEGQRKYVKNQYLPKDIVIKLYSRHLQDVVREYFPNNMKQFESYGEIQAKDLLILYVNGKWPGRTSVSWSDLPSTLDDEHGKNHLHMFHLTRFLEKEYANTIKQYERMMKARIISWDMLWTLIVPGIDVIYYCEISNQELCGKVFATSYDLEKREPGNFSVDLEVYDFDSNNFVVVNVRRGLSFFKDDVKIINLDVFPLQCKANPQESEESLFQRGKIFCDLVLKYERQFMHYEGLMYESAHGDFMRPTYSQGRAYNFKASIDGRVMIDQTWFAKLKSTGKMDKTRGSGWNPINERSETRIKAIANEFDAVLKYSPAIAYGYSFSIRKWGCFDITRFSKIHFVSTAFDKLVMKEENKRTLVTLTEYYINNTQGISNTATCIDVLPNKGQGCIIVLHGPPGTGKTLTVESLAERLECPLWQLSITELWASSGQLENQLLSTFEVAKSWGAILVLDEADVYLSSRKYSPLSSNNTPNNAMTGVFLRVLEYYKGVLFLTTNVMSHIEPAIFSRISLFIKYEEFNIEERKRLWSNFLEESKISHLSGDFWKKVLPVEFNGRVIRNIVQSAQILIQSKYFGTETPEQCVLRAFDAMTDPSTLNFLVEAHEVHETHAANQSIQEVAPSIPSASIDSDLLLAYTRA